MTEARGRLTMSCASLQAVCIKGRWLLLAAALANAIVLWYFHDQHWHAVDEGIWAHVAERLLAGDVLHRDVQEAHPGYIDFLNAAAFWVFGVDLVSLRYPLMIAAFIQAILVWLLLARHDPLLATAGSLAATALGVLQFLNATPHWYCLLLVVCLVCWLSWMPQRHPARVLGAGILIGVITLFRQLTGVWVAMSVLLILLREQSTTARGRETLVARGLLLLMLLALGGYLSFTRGPDLSGILLVASWPAAIVGLMLWNTATTNRASLRIVGHLTLGVIVAALPILLYHLAHGSLAAWIDDTVFAAPTLSRLDFLEGTRYALMPVAGFLTLVDPSTPTAFVNGLYWVLLPLVPAMNGILAIRSTRHGGQDVPILPLVAAFYSLVTLHMAGPIYLHFTIGLTFAAVLWFAATGRSARLIRCTAAAAAGVAFVALWFHAAQSSFRRPIEIARGHRTLTPETATCPPLRRSTLRIEWKDCDEHHQLVARIEAETPPGASIFAIPHDPELYFLSARSNPFRFYSTAIGVRSPSDLAAVLEVLDTRPPALVTYRRDDKYNTDASRRIIEYVRSRYDRFATIAGVELYRPTAALSSRVGAKRPGADIAAERGEPAP